MKNKKNPNSDNSNKEKEVIAFERDLQESSGLGAGALIYYLAIVLFFSNQLSFHNGYLKLSSSPCTSEPLPLSPVTVHSSRDNKTTRCEDASAVPPNLPLHLLPSLATPSPPLLPPTKGPSFYRLRIPSPPPSRFFPSLQPLLYRFPPVTKPEPHSQPQLHPPLLLLLISS